MLGIDRLHLWEKFEKEEASIIVDWSLLKKIEKLYKLGIIRKEEYEELYNKVKYEIDKSLKNINKLLKQIKNPRELLLKIFALHAL
jgi:DNA-binding HxlR family transcriptional regulator